METLATKAIIYDSTCPMCNLYTRAFVKIGVLGKQGRVSFQEADASTMQLLDLNRARHEIPLVDTTSGEVLYGLDSLTLILSNIFPFTGRFITTAAFKNFFKPLYNFISYNRRVIAGSPIESCGFNCGPDFNLGWRLRLIALGMCFTAASIYAFAVLTGISNIWMLFAFVFAYFILLMAVNLTGNKTYEQKWDYLGHLATLGIIESTVFLFTALLAKATGLTGLLFAGQGAGRLFVLWLHHKRVSNNHYSARLDYAFGAGACMLILYLSFVLK
jgi:hypothetical protein